MDLIKNSPFPDDRPCLQKLHYLQGRGGRRVRVIESVATNWEYLAQALHFEDGVIETVRRDAYNRAEDSCQEVLRLWLEGQAESRQPVNWGTLIDSLSEAGFVDVAEDLQAAVEDSPLLQDWVTVVV